MRLAVTGAAGGLGRAFMAVVPSHHDIAPLAHGDLDIGDHHSVMQTIVPLKPDAIVNLAAYTKVDACETDPSSAMRANALGPQSLALAARACGAVLLHVSTDYVFDGEKGSPYDELDTPNPRSIYARSKLAGEELVRRVTPEHFVVRTGFVFGAGTDYISGAVARLVQGESVGALSDRIGTPTFVRHLAERILPLVLTGRFGTYHLAGREPTTWFDVLERVRAAGNLSGEVTRQRAVDLALPAPRPRNSALTSVFASEIGIAPMPPLDDAVKELLDSLS